MVNLDHTQVEYGSVSPNEATTLTSGSVTYTATANSGYRFVDWLVVPSSGNTYVSKDPAITVKYDASVMTVWLYPTFAYGIYTVTLDWKGGEPGSPKSLTVTNSPDATWSLLPTPTRTGYDFLGWYDGDTVIASSGKRWLTENKSLVAKWEAHEYTLSVTKPAAGISKLVYKAYADGEWNWKETSSSFNTRIPCGSTFAWYAVADTGYTTTYPSEQAACTGAMPASNLAFTVVATRKTHTLTFDAGAGKVIETNGTEAATLTRTMHYDEYFGTMPDAALDLKHKFNGWFDQENGGKEYTATSRYPLDGAMTLYAHWTEADTYAVTGVASPSKGGTVSGGGSYYAGQSVTLLAVAKKGYSFERWDNGEEETERVVVVGNISATYTAYFSPNIYRAAFDAVRPEATVSPVEKYVTYDAAYGELPEPTCPDYEFLGWYSSSDYATGTEITPESVVSTTGKSGVITLYAKWRKIPVFYVAFDGNGATDGSMATQKIVRDTWTALSSNAFLRTGYEYGGGWTNANGEAFAEGEEVANLADEGATETLYAKWTPNRYHVVFDANGQRGTMAPLSNCTYDVAFELPENKFYDLTGTFLGWSTNAAASVAEWADKATVRNLATDGSVTLYAVWMDLENDLTKAAHGKNVILTTRGEHPYTAYTNALGETSALSGKMVSHYPQPSDLSILSVTVRGPGRLSFNWKASATSPFSVLTNAVYVSRKVPDSRSSTGYKYDITLTALDGTSVGNGWTNTVFAFTGKETDVTTVEWRSSALSDSEYLLVDRVVWTPAGDADVPTEEDAPTIGGFSPTADGFSLSFTSDARFDYRLLSTSTLTPPDWQPDGETKEGSGDELSFGISPGSDPVKFFKVEVLQRGTK